MTESTEPKRPPWVNLAAYSGVVFGSKTWGRVFVHSPEHVQAVLDIMLSIDEEETRGYLPLDFVTVWPGPESARLIYGHKFTLRLDLLELACFGAGIPVLIVTGMCSDFRGGQAQNRLQFGPRG